MAIIVRIGRQEVEILASIFLPEAVTGMQALARLTTPTDSRKTPRIRKASKDSRRTINNNSQPTMDRTADSTATSARLAMR